MSDANVQRTQLTELVSRLERLDRQLKSSKSAGTLRPAFASIDEMHAEAEAIVLRVVTLRKHSDKLLEKRRMTDAASAIDTLVAGGTEVDGFIVVAATSGALSLDELKGEGDTLRSKLRSGVGVLSAVIDGKVQLVCVVTDDLISGRQLKAGVIVGRIAKLVGGGGGGRPHLATAGGKDVTKVAEALAKTPEIIRSFL